MQIFLNGCVTGLVISLVALSFTSVYLSTRVFHLALGGVFTAAPFIVWSSVRSGIPWPIGVVIALLVGTLVSLLCELVNHSRLSRKRVSAGSHLISSLGLYIVITQLIVMRWGSDAQTLRHGVSRVINISGISLTPPQIVAASVSTLVMILFFLWLRLSRKGLQFRALSDNENEVALRGYNIRRLRLLAFGLSGLLCSGGAILLSYDRGFSPYGGITAILLAVVAMIVGGRQTFLGPVIGGLIVGVLREETAYLFAARWQELFTFLLLALFILVRPSGLIGKKGRLESEP